MYDCEMYLRCMLNCLFLTDTQSYVKQLINISLHDVLSLCYVFVYIVN